MGLGPVVHELLADAGAQAHAHLGLAVAEALGRRPQVLLVEAVAQRHDGEAGVLALPAALSQLVRAVGGTDLPGRVDLAVGQGRGVAGALRQGPGVLGPLPGIAGGLEQPAELGHVRGVVALDVGLGGVEREDGHPLAHEPLEDLGSAEVAIVVREHDGVIRLRLGRRADDGLLAVELLPSSQRRRHASEQPAVVEFDGDTRLGCRLLQLLERARTGAVLLRSFGECDVIAVAQARGGGHLEGPIGELLRAPRESREERHLRVERRDIDHPASREDVGAAPGEGRRPRQRHLGRHLRCCHGRTDQGRPVGRPGGRRCRAGGRSHGRPQEGCAEDQGGGGPQGERSRDVGGQAHGLDPNPGNPALTRRLRSRPRGGGADQRSTRSTALRSRGVPRRAWVCGSGADSRGTPQELAESSRDSAAREMLSGRLTDQSGGPA